MGAPQSPAVVDPLTALSDDLNVDGQPSLAWVVEFVPDGDVAAAIARLWREPPSIGHLRYDLFAAKDNGPNERSYLVADACRSLHSAAHDCIWREPNAPVVAWEIPCCLEAFVSWFCAPPTITLR